MSNTYFSGRKGRYIFCDICGQATYVYECVKLDAKTGRGGLIVCPRDVDKIDAGLIPYILPIEQAVKWVRINHTNVENGAAVLDYDTTTELGV